MSENRTIPSDSTYDVVSFSLLAGGQDVTQNYQVLSLVVVKEVNRIPMARIVLRDGDASSEDFPTSSGEDFVPGQEIEIAVGYDSSNTSVFTGIIVKHAIKLGPDGNTILQLECKDEAVKLTIGRKNRYFTEATDSDAMEEIIGEYGLGNTITATSATHPDLVQYHATDWDFLLSRAEINGMIVLVDAGQITVQPPTISGSEVLTLTYGATMLQFEAEMDARTQLSAVNASAWSYTDQALVEEEGEDPGFDSHGNISGSDLADVIGLSTLDLRHSGQVLGEELKGWADAQLLKSRLGKIQGKVLSRGSVDVLPDTLVELAGVGDRFNGTAYVSGVRHEIRENTWTMWVQIGLSPQWFSEREDIVDSQASGLLPGINGLQVAIVTQIHEDPDGEDRVLVKMPIVDGEAEGIWARVASLDAGNERGAFFRPEVDDEVVVGFVNDDPRDPIILGMLHSSSLPAPIAAEETNPEKGFVTREQIKLLFNDETKTVTIETPGGNKVILDDDQGSILLEDQNGNTITMDSNGVAISSAADLTLEAGSGKIEIKAGMDLKMEGGTNAELKAGAQLKAEGGAGAEFTTSAIAKIQGSLVQIN